MSLHLVVTRCSLGAYCSSSHFPDYFILLRGIFGTALGHGELIAKVTPVLARATASLCGLCWLRPLHLSVHLKEPGSGCLAHAVCWGRGTLKWMAGSTLTSSEDPGPLGLHQSLLISVQLTEVVLKLLSSG